MKKLTIFCMLLGVVMLGFWACEKEPVHPKTTSYVPAPGSGKKLSAEQQKVLIDIKKIKANHSLYQPSTTDGGPILKGLGIDLIGALFWTAIWEGNWIGGSVMGIFSSWGYWSGYSDDNPAATSYPSKVPYNDFDDQEYTNDDNPYDIEGVKHNLVGDLVAGRENEFNGGQQVNYGNLRGIVIEEYENTYGAINMEIPSTEEIVNVHNIIISEQTWDAKCDALEALGGLTSFTSSVLKTYFSNIEGITNATDFVNYTKQVEATIISSNLSDEDKHLLLGAFSVGRFSYGYWNRVCTK